MSIRSHQSEFRQPESRGRRYPVLCLFDVTLNIMLSAGILALGCACLGIILAQNAPRFLPQVCGLASHIWG